MNKRILLGLLVGLCTLSACSHEDEKIVISDGKPADGDSCVTADFKSQCRTDISYIVCENDTIATKSCGKDQACLGGECKDLAVLVEKTDCVPADYTSTCFDDTHRTLCNQDGKVEIEVCRNGLTCSEGVCSDGTITENPDCTDVGCACSRASFRNTCTETTRTACDFGTITEIDCASDGLECLNGECVVPAGKTCDSSFESKCIGNQWLHCDDEGLVHQVGDPENTSYLSLMDCGIGICTAFDGHASCYMPCDTEGKSICIDDDSAYLLKCTKNEDGLFYVPEKSDTCLACFTSVLGKEIREIDRGDEIGEFCATKSCSASVEDHCEGNKVVSCYDDYLVEHDCGDHACVEDDDGAFCADECSQDQVDTHKYTCGLENDDDVVYRSRNYLCRSIGDKYYWMLDDVLDCKKGCDGATGECIKSHPDEGRKCDYYDNKYESQCADNRLISCDGEHVSVQDCGDNTCLKFNDNHICAALCTDEDRAGNGYMCQWGNFSVSFECVEAEPGKYVKNVSTDDMDMEEPCRHGCDEKTGQCIKLDEREGQTCDPRYNMGFCANNNVYLTCEMSPEYNENGDPVFQYWAWQCDDRPEDDNTFVCIQPENERPDCVRACTESDVDKNNATCEGKYDSNVSSCIKAGDVYYWHDVHMSCDRGCDEKTGECIRIHDDEGKVCGSKLEPEPGDEPVEPGDEPVEPGDEPVDDVEPEEYCDGSIILRCEDGFIRANDCAEEAVYVGDVPDTIDIEKVKNTCASWTEDYGVVTGCMPACTADDVTKTYVVCEDNSIYGWECLKSGDNYFWKSKHDYCNHGCDEKANSCVKLHEDEGKVCEGESRCANDRILLSCEGVYVAEDCAEIGGACVTDGIEAKCSNECTEDDYNNDVQKKVCVGANELGVFGCWHGYEYDYQWENDHLIDCAHGCDSEKNECVTIHKDEGKGCHPYEYYDYDKEEVADADENYCDGKMYLACRESYEYGPEYEGVWAAEACEFGCNADLGGCYEPCTTVGETSSCAEDGALITESCKLDSKTKIKYKTTESEYCRRGCDSKKNECIKIHEDEGKPCSWDSDDDNYYASKCEGGMHLYCELSTVVAESCGSLSCNNILGCYKSCAEVDDDKLIFYCGKRNDEIVSRYGYCEEDPETGIKYVTTEDYDYCMDTCNEESGKCAELDY